MSFIKISDRILDFQQYKKDVAALRFELAYELKECLAKYGFEAVKKDFRSYHGVRMVFRNDSGLVVSIAMTKGCIKN